LSKIVDEFIALLSWKVDDEALQQLGKQAESAGQKLESIGGKLQGAGLALSAIFTAPIVGLGVASIKAAGEVEQLQTSFEVLLGSVEAAGKMKEDIQNMAAVTPFETTDLANNAKTLLSFGESSETVLETMRRLGDVSLGNKDRFNRLSLAFGQVEAKGRLMGGEVLQMVENGFNPLQEISQKTGKSMKTLTDEMEEGKISVQMVRDAFTSATSEGGRFYKGMEKQSGTLFGIFSTLKDYISQAFAAIGESVLPELKSVVEIAIGWAKAFKNIAEIFKELPAPIKWLIIGAAGFLAALGPVLLAVGTLLSSIGSIAVAVAAFQMGFLAMPAALAPIGAAISAAFWPVVAIAAAIGALIFLFGILRDDFETWKSGGESAFGSFWEKLEGLKTKFLEFVEPIKEFFGNVFRALVTGATKYFNMLKTAFGVFLAILRVVSGIFWDIFGPGILKSIGIIKDAAIFIGKSFMNFVSDINTVFTAIMEGISKIWDSEPVKFIRKQVGKISEYGYSGDTKLLNNYGAAFGWNSGAGMVPGGNTSNFSASAGDVYVQVAGSNASPAAIGSATRGGVSSAFGDVAAMNRPFFEWRQ